MLKSVVERIEQSKRPGGFKTLSKFSRDTGLSRSVLWTYRKRGWLVTENINGTVIVTTEAEEQFIQRMMSGEFSKSRVVPKRIRGTKPGNKVEADGVAA